MSNRPLIDPLTDNIAGLTEAERSDAMRRFEAIRPHVLHGVSLTELARNTGISLRSLQRWSTRYRAAGISGLARSRRSDIGKRRLPSLSATPHSDQETPPLTAQAHNAISTG